MSKIWFITGANRGIGLEIVKSALAAGDKVVATARQPDTLRAALAEQVATEQLLCLPLDVSREADAVQAVEQALAHFGRIDVLVNNAGYGQFGLFEEIATADIARQFDTNVFGLMSVTRAVLPAMRRQRSGQIFNVSSVAGFMAFSGSSLYCATKFAVTGFSASLAMEVAGFGIRVTIVEPGFFRTDFLDASSVRYSDAKIADYARLPEPPQSRFDAYHTRQPGDPAKLGPALVQIANMEQPPLHFVAGSDAVGFAEQTFGQRLAEVRAHAALSASLDGDF
ncbi:SDR family NAD(P)-dependent oxidoreductase [Roseateles amylovorans]|uniref:SDR family NAD(P)-dependent oxidoreductase n=1 Tax=Roseateles amylovorans TaxID=2978473 RepID=A0ABY6B2U1_9BURK|nr:SDR family NAD(P)-dependent oxidoreductase [Roseateles amylovorans]UXH79029.1 SDR family NAD(P)-dependent oxidoreductase [Roseateles amylovorans]